MLSLSVLWALITLGFAVFWYAVKVYQVARTAEQNAENETWILFGKQLNKNQLDREFIQRLDAVIEQVHVRTPKHLVLQGGLTGKNSLSEAKAGQNYLLNSAAFVQQARRTTTLILEDRSKNTLENLRYTRQHLQHENIGLNVSIISSRYHLLRCAVIAQNMGFSTAYLPAEPEFTLNLKQSINVLIEAVYLNWYSTGRFVGRLLNNQRILKKIG